jgi:hypothetical protein
MPNIVIISVRLNLDKDDDRILFEKLQKRLGKVDQSRNEFLKHLLLNCLSGKSQAGKAAARPLRKPQPHAPAGKATPAAEKLPEKVDEQGLSDADAAALVSSFVN